MFHHVGAPEETYEHDVIIHNVFNVPTWLWRSECVCVRYNMCGQVTVHLSICSALLLTIVYRCRTVLVKEYATISYRRARGRSNIILKLQNKEIDFGVSIQIFQLLGLLIISPWFSPRRLN